MKKAIGYLIGAVLAAGIGYYIRGLVPTGAPGGMPGMGQMPPAAVTAIELKERPLDVLDDYIASVEPVQQVMVRSEVSGYIDAVNFTEGATVKEGDLLFSIDRKRYDAQLKVRQADVASAQAELTRATKYLQRMIEAGARSISQNELDIAESNATKAEAALKQAEANLNLAQIDLDYSQVRAPISGRIGQANLTKGNYVTPGTEALAQIVQIDPIRVVFSMTDRAYLGLRQQEIAGNAQGLNAHIRLPDGTLLDTVGQKDFDSNRMNKETGTIAIRYLFDNKDGLLVAGGYVNILVGAQERPTGLRIPQRAILAGAEGNYVLTVTAEGTVAPAPVKLGKTIDTDMVILSGLKAGDKVIVDGLQKARPGATVNATIAEAN
jgi:RND family efflux transporter MFP subunit